MFRNRTLTGTAAAALLLTITTSPILAARGRADFTRYVAIGDSFGAGVSNASLVGSHQHFSYPAIIARQARTPDFQQPLVSEPGIGPELQLLNLIPVQIAPKATTNGAPINLNLPRPYSNLSIPGARVSHLITLTGREAATSTPTIFAQFILRGQATAVDQALAQQPTFISAWIGGNDVLGAVLDGTPASLTPVADFRRDYAAMLDRLIQGAPNAGIIVGSLAEITAFPYATTVPPVLVNPATNSPVLINGAPIFLVADLGGGTIGQLTPDSLVLLPAASLIATGFGIPEALRAAFPNLPNVGRPLPDAVVLSPAEIQIIQRRVVDLDTAIREIAAARDVPVTDLAPTFQRLKTGYNVLGVTISTAFLTGGFFSYDGFHPTDIGYTLIANEFIKTINSAYGTRIPQASLLPFFAGNARDEDSKVEVYKGMPFDFPLISWQSLLSVAGNSEKSLRRRR